MVIQIILRTLFLLILPLSSALAEDKSLPPLKIGWIGPLTGSAAVLGVDALKSIEIAFEEAQKDANYTGPKIELIAQDDQYIAKNTVTAYKELVHNRKIDILFIYTYSGLFAVSKLAEKDGVLLIDPLDCDEDIAKLPSNTVCIAKLTEDLGKVVGKYIARKKLGPTAIFHIENDAFPVKAAEQTKVGIEELGGKVPLFESYQTPMNDLRPLLLKAKRAKARSICVYGYTEQGIALRQIHEMALPVHRFTLGNILSPDILQTAGNGADGVIFANWQAAKSKKLEDFLAAFELLVGRKPHIEVSTIPSYDAANIIVETLQKKNDADWEDIKERFYTLKDYPGASGNITMDKDGITRNFGIVIQQYKDKKVVTIKR